MINFIISVVCCASLADEQVDFSAADILKELEIRKSSKISLAAQMDMSNSALLVGAIAASNSYDGSKDAAIRTLAMYNFKAYSLDKDFKKLQREYLPEEFKRYGGIAAAITSAVARKRVSFVWTF